MSKFYYKGKKLMYENKEVKDIDELLNRKCAYIEQLERDLRLKQDITIQSIKSDNKIFNYVCYLKQLYFDENMKYPTHLVISKNLLIGIEELNKTFQFMLNEVEISELIFCGLKVIIITQPNILFVGENLKNIDLFTKGVEDE